MQVFKTACKIIFRHPAYLVIYIILLGFLGIFLVGSSTNEPTAEYQESRPPFAVIDRDGSALSHGLTDFLKEHGELVELEDNIRSFQDAAAQSTTSYIAIIPEGFGDQFVSAVQTDGTVPEIESIISYESINGALMDNLVNQYLTTAELLAYSSSSQTLSELAAQLSTIMNEQVDISIYESSSITQMSEQYAGFIKFSAYPMIVGIIVCIGLFASTFNATDLRKRNLASPITGLSLNLQAALACVIVALLAWAWINLLGYFVFKDSLMEVPFESLGLVLLLTLVLTTLPLSVGYLIAQLGMKENAINAIGNIFALVLSFFGALFVDPSFLSTEVVAVAHFIPTFWYGEAVSAIYSLAGSMTQEVIFIVLRSCGIILLFSIAFFMIALVVSRLKVQSFDAGGNAAASSKA